MDKVRREHTAKTELTHDDGLFRVSFVFFFRFDLIAGRTTGNANLFLRISFTIMISLALYCRSVMQRNMNGRFLFSVCFSRQSVRFIRVCRVDNELPSAIRIGSFEWCLFLPDIRTI